MGRIFSKLQLHKIKVSVTVTITQNSLIDYIQFTREKKH